MRIPFRFLTLLNLMWQLRFAMTFVIAPPWANQVSNPCSSKSWQLLYWPKTKKCYPIFKQGPCPETQELGYNAVTKEAECGCPKGLIHWTPTDRCYEEYSKGPCEPYQYLERNSDEGSVQCSNVKRCQNGWVFWPSEKKCFQLYTQGPCHKGDLLIMNALTAEPYCGCDSLLLHQYYFQPLGLCYEHFTRGPCESGMLFAYNHTSQTTHCMCSQALSNYHIRTQQCFQFDTKGPCSNGQTFQLDQSSGFGVCTCRDNYVLWKENGECYKSFTPGPCEKDEFLIPSEEGSTVGKCVQNPCPRAHLYFPDGPGDSVKCHKVGSQGPCPLGELVIFEKYSGKSYRGECGCSPGYNQNYWPDTGKCYEWFSRGPCPPSFLFQFNKETGVTECVCDQQRGFVFWNETAQCYRVYTQGPCPENAWLLPGESGDVFCECKTGWNFDPLTYSCKLANPIVAITGAAMARPLIGHLDHGRQRRRFDYDALSRSQSRKPRTKALPRVGRQLLRRLRS